jgi:hypothetical protein
MKFLKTRRARAPRPSRPWPVTAIGWLLMLEAAGFLAIAALYVSAWATRLAFMPQQWIEQRLIGLTGMLFCLLAILSLTSAYGFFRLARAAWMSAVLAQGFSLSLALVQYFGSRPAFVYPMMLFGIFMVLYLHQADVQAAFQPQPEQPPAVRANP